MERAAITSEIRNPKQIVEMGSVRVFIYFYHNIANTGWGHLTKAKEFVGTHVSAGTEWQNGANFTYKQRESFISYLCPTKYYSL